MNVERTSVIIADDHKLVRAGLKLLLEKNPNIKVIAEADDGRDAINFVRDLQPDVAILDIGMKNLNGLEAAAQISRDYPDVKIIILSMHSNEEYIYQAFNVGASAYLLKDSATDELETAINFVIKDKMFISPSISQQVVLALKKGSANNPLNLLSLRQREILQLIAEGKSVKEISQLLNISIKTVETHKAQLMDKIEIHDIAGLVKFAIRVGLINI